MVTKYSKTDTKDMIYIDYGVTLFKKEVLQFIPEKQKYALEDLFVRLIDMKQLLAYDIKERFYEIGSVQGLKDFQAFAQSKLKS
jgi:NDP-sugar pyrophosphorylase family protein